MCITGLSREEDVCCSFFTQNIWWWPVSKKSQEFVDWGSMRVINKHKLIIFAEDVIQICNSQILGFTIWVCDISMLEPVEFQISNRKTGHSQKKDIEGYESFLCKMFARLINHREKTTLALKARPRIGGICAPNNIASVGGMERSEDSWKRVRTIKWIKKNAKDRNKRQRWLRTI